MFLLRPVGTKHPSSDNFTRKRHISFVLFIKKKDAKIKHE